MDTIQSYQNAGNIYQNHTDTNNTQNTAPEQTPDQTANFTGTDDMVAFSDETKEAQYFNQSGQESQQYNKKYEPTNVDRYLKHLGRSDTQISSLKMRDEFLKSMKNGPQKDDPAAEKVFSTVKDFMQKKVGAPVGIPAEMFSKAAGSMMGCIQNDAYLNGLNNYKQWRDQHPNASNEEIRNYINGQMGQAFNPMATLSDSMNAGTLNMKDADRQKYNDNKDVMLSAMMEFSYTNMNKQYGNKW